jgi:phage virion morphogenesis protein
MFAKLRTSKFLKTEVSPESAVVTFSDEVQRIANVHQHGLRDKVNRRRNLETDYPERKLLGITHTDVLLVKELVINHLAR